MQRRWRTVSLIGVGVFLGLVGLAEAAPVVQSYTIDSVPSLSEIALRLYGSSGAWREIAEWNGLKPPYRLRRGQKLILKRSPTLTPAQGNQLVLEMWRRRLAERAGVQASRAQTTEAEPARGVEDIKREKTIQKQMIAALSAPTSAEAPAAPTPVPRAPWVAAAFVSVSPSEPLRTTTPAGALEQGRRDLAAGKVEDALRSLRQAKALEPGMLEARLMEIQALVRLGRFDEARVAGKDLVKRWPELSQLPALVRLGDGGGVP